LYAADVCAGLEHHHRAVARAKNHIDIPLVSDAQDLSLTRWLRITHGAVGPPFARGLDMAVDGDRMHGVLPLAPCLQDRSERERSRTPSAFHVQGALLSRTALWVQRKDCAAADQTPCRLHSTIADVAEAAQLRSRLALDLCDGAALRKVLWAAAWGDHNHLLALAGLVVERLCCADDAASLLLPQSFVNDALAVALARVEAHNDLCEKWLRL
jgi:hypothetical protein